MAKTSIIQQSWYGGIANDRKVGKESSYQFSKHLNIYDDANVLTPYPKTVKMSGSTVVNLVLWAADGTPYDTNRYFYDLGGNLYRETSLDVWSNLRTVSGSSGQGLIVFDDYLYYAGATTLGRYGRLSGTPAFTDNFLADGTTNLDQSGSDFRTVTGNTYAVPVAISETSVNRQTFAPNHDPLTTIGLYVSAKGTGNWTVTVHDSENNNLGSATITNASLTNSAVNDFTFSTAIRVLIDIDYHFHVTSTVADGTLRSGTSDDLETSDYYNYFGILIDSDYHPMESLLRLHVSIMINRRSGCCL